MQTSYVVMAAIYILQILDANVDAQLMTFNVSDDLSLMVSPASLPQTFNSLNAPYMGISLAIKFK